jgi:hypothetical protein
MKRLFSLVLALGLSYTGVFAQGAGGAKHMALQLLSGSGNLFLTNGGTYTAFNTNTIFLNSIGTSNIQSFTPYYTNTIVQPSGTTVSNVLFYGAASHDVDIWADANADVAPLTVSVMLNNPGYLPGDNQNANPGTNFPGLYAATVTSNAQVITFTLEKVLWGTNADTTTTNQFTFNVTVSGTNIIMASTNLPTAFVQGAKGIRFASAASTTNANTTGNTINRVTVTGYAP